MKQLSLYIAVIFLSIALLPAEFSRAASEVKTQDLLLELKGKSSRKISERDSYAEIASAFDAKDLIRLQTHTQSFLRFRKNSVFAPKALYLLAHLQAEKKRYPEALKTIGRIEKNYRQSSRMVSAQFLKAMIFKKIYLPDQSRAVLAQLMKSYPGSPESFRAQSELRYLKDKVN